jgi:hypothetical protein
MRLNPRGRSHKVRPRRRAYRIKPAADVDLSVRLSAEVASADRIRGFQVPAENRQLRVATLNDEPVQRIIGHRSADLTSELLNLGHRFPCAKKGYSIGVHDGSVED